jgi:hypothetical protein
MVNRSMSHLSALLVLFGLIAGACAIAGSPTPQPTVSPSASPSPTGAAVSPSPIPSPDASPTPTAGGQQVTSAAQAAALVFTTEPRFARMTALQPDLIGQSAWYEASETADGYSVAVTLGSGDCFAGCIDQHTWTYHVGFDGTITLVGDEGDEVEISPPEGTDAPMTARVLLAAGPVCPVEQVPPAPGCEPRPIINAEVVLRDPSGAEIAHGATNEEGIVEFQVPGGAYYVEAEPVEGMMSMAAAQALSGVGGDVVGVTLGFDTGIR